MEARVTALENKVDGLLTSIASDVAYLKGKSEGAPNARDFGELKGRVDSLPTSAKMATYLAIAVAVITILNKWPALSAALFSS